MVIETKAIAEDFFVYVGGGEARASSRTGEQQEQEGGAPSKEKAKTTGRSFTQKGMTTCKREQLTE